MRRMKRAPKDETGFIAASSLEPSRPLVWCLLRYVASRSVKSAREATCADGQSSARGPTSRRPASSSDVASRTAETYARVVDVG